MQDKCFCSQNYVIYDSNPEIEVKAKIAKVDQGKFHLCSEILFTFTR